MAVVNIYGGTDRGMVRRNNEDSIGFVQFEHSPISLGIVADGVGGHEGGEVASRMAVDAIEEYVRKSVLQATSGGGYGDHWLEKTLINSIEEANRLITNVQATDKHLSSMATTVVTILIKEEELCLAYLGDSRCYRWRNNHLEQISHDHTVAQQLLDEGSFSEEQIQLTPYHHVLSRALGLDGVANADSINIKTEDSDIYLLCSDGLTNCLSDKQIEEIIKNKKDINECAEELIASANDAGGADNISVVLAQFTSD